MVGKASLFLVLGFSLIFLVFGQKFSSLGNSAVDNMTNYYSESVAHDCAASGANLAANQLFLDPTWRTGFTNLSLNNGTINVAVNEIDPFQDIIQIVSTGTFNGITKKVTVTLKPSKFSKFAYFSVSEGDNIWWIGKDTVWGPFHTQDYMRVENHPVFMGKATTAKSLIYYTNKKSDEPHFFSTFEDGQDEPLPTDGLAPIKAAAQNNGFFQPLMNDTVVTGGNNGGGWGWNKHHHTTTTITPDTAYITFVNDSVQIKLGYDKTAHTYLTHTLAPNGAIYVEGMDVRLKGTVQGQYTVASDCNIYLDDDIVYKNNPNIINNNNTDLLGIVAQKNVIITDNKANHKDINIDAAIYTQGSFTAENYDNLPVCGNINLIGGITQNVRGPVGLFNYGGNISSGFAKRYAYDQRLMISSPPFFPGTGRFEIVSWLDE